MAGRPYLIIVLALVACGAPAPQVSAPSAQKPCSARRAGLALSDGSPAAATDAAFAAVGGITIKSGDTVGVCTGTLVCSNLVLTSAHCLRDWQPQEVFFSQKSRMTEPQSVTDAPDFDARATAFFIHPDYATTDRTVTRQADLALFRLDRRLDAFTPFQLADAAIPGSPTDLLPAMVVGYGVTGEDLAGRGTKRYVGGAYAGARPRHDADLLFAASDDKVVCEGDSGSPLLVGDVRTKQLVLMGVLSGGGGDEGKACSNVEVMSGVFRSAAWIRGVMAQNCTGLVAPVGDAAAPHGAGGGTQTLPPDAAGAGTQTLPPVASGAGASGPAPGIALRPPRSAATARPLATNEAQCAAGLGGCGALKPGLDGPRRPAPRRDAARRRYAEFQRSSASRRVNRS